MKKSNKKPNIRFRPSLFWDVDPKIIDPKKHARYIIERVIDFGGDTEVRWLWSFYSRGLIRDVVKKSRVLHNFSRPLWILMTEKR